MNANSRKPTSNMGSEEANERLKEGSTTTPDGRRPPMPQPNAPLRDCGPRRKDLNTTTGLPGPALVETAATSKPFHPKLGSEGCLIRRQPAPGESVFSCRGSPLAVTPFEACLNIPLSEGRILQVNTSKITTECIPDIDQNVKGDLVTLKKTLDSILDDLQVQKTMDPAPE